MALVQHRLAGPLKGRARVPRRVLVVRVVQTAAPAVAPTKNESVQKADQLQFINPLFSQVKTEEQFRGILQSLVDAGKCPPQLMLGWLDFYNNYKGAVTGSGVPGADETFATMVQASIADVVFNQFVDPYTFPSFHKRLLEPYNYYEFGQRYTGSLINFEESVLGQRERWAAIAAQLAAGDNVVLLANHQTEADPGVFAHMLADSFPHLAEEVIYVAGDRVVSDALCKPFSMGRNLFCVYSKKRMELDEPEVKAAKMDTNRKTLVAMQRALVEGGKLVWIAPSGGRDRPSEEDVWLPDKFDPPAVELMRNLTARAKRPGHIYPMAMFSYPLMPPPKTLDKDLGERRLTAFTPVGISVCEELDPIATIAGIEEKEAAQAKLATAAWEAVTAEYQLLEAAIRDPAVRAAGPWSQPWKGV